MIAHLAAFAHLLRALDDDLIANLEADTISTRPGWRRADAATSRRVARAVLDDEQELAALLRNEGGFGDHQGVMLVRARAMTLRNMPGFSAQVGVRHGARAR